MKKQRRMAGITGLVALAMEAIMLAVYIAFGRNQFSPNLSMAVLISAGAGILLNLAAVCIRRREAFFMAYFADLFALLSYITTQLTLLANIIYDVDGSSIPVELIAICLCGLAAAVLNLVTGAAVLREGKEEADA